MQSNESAAPAALLDVDGTLLLSNGLHAEAWRRAFAEFGYDVPDARLHPMIGMGGDKLLAAIDPDLRDDRPPGSQIAERRTAIFLADCIGRAVPAPGARDLVERLRSEYKIVIATSAKDHELQALLAAAGIADLVDAAATSDDAKRSKPDPDIVQSALHRSASSADAAVMLGDTRYDIEAAERAGVTIVAVRCGGSSDDDLVGAAAIYDDPADLLRNFEGSPFGR